jgi:hypothetical protein
MKTVDAGKHPLLQGWQMVVEKMGEDAAGMPSRLPEITSFRQSIRWQKKRRQDHPVDGGVSGS